MQAVENARHALELVLRSEAKDIHEKYVEPPYTTTSAYRPSNGRKRMPNVVV